jgi:hypothetical protein
MNSKIITFNLYIIIIPSQLYFYENIIMIFKFSFN